MKKVLSIVGILLVAPVYSQQEVAKAAAVNVIRNNNQNGADATALAHFYLQKLQYVKRSLDLIQSSQPFNTLYAQDKHAATAVLPLESARIESARTSLTALYNELVDLYMAAYKVAQKQRGNLTGLPASITKL